MSTTRARVHVNAPCANVYRALTDARAVASWQVPTGMTSHVHAFDAREGGQIRISLTYDDAASAGKSSAHTDTYHGQFVTLVPDASVVETMVFETDDPAMQGEMTVRYTLAEKDGGTEVEAVHEGVPDGVSAEDNEVGWRMALEKLAAFVEAMPMGV